MMGIPEFCDVNKSVAPYSAILKIVALADEKIFLIDTRVKSRADKWGEQRMWVVYRECGVMCG